MDDLNCHNLSYSNIAHRVCHPSIHSFIYVSSVPTCPMPGHGGLELILEATDARQVITPDGMLTHGGGCHPLYVEYTKVYSY